MNKILQRVKDSFRDKALFEQSLTHRSWINENPGKRESNERLEFLGDAILEFVVSSTLYNELPDKEEGFLTALRANLVNTINLTELARKIGVGEELFLSRGELRGGGNDNTSILADTVEAIIGAVYIDQGFDAAKAFIDENILIDLAVKMKQPLKDPKSRFQEEVQARGYLTPKYHVVNENGPDHDKEFVVEVIVGGKAMATGNGKSKNEAEQSAAKAALENLS